MLRAVHAANETLRGLSASDVASRPQPPCQLAVEGSSVHSVQGGRLPGCRPAVGDGGTRNDDVLRSRRLWLSSLAPRPPTVPGTADERRPTA